jgi:hypothetical protein
MDDRQNSNPQPGLIAWLTAMWQAFDKKQWATIGGVILTLGALVVAGVRKGVPWYRAHK